jgi:hypothetical protein
MVQQIRVLLKTTPFQPFDIRCSNGEIYHVGHPENAAVVGNFVIVEMPDGENAIMLSPLHIVGVVSTDSVPA